MTIGTHLHIITHGHDETQQKKNKQKPYGLHVDLCFINYYFQQNKCRYHEYFALHTKEL